MRFWIQIPYPNWYLLIDALKWEISILYHGSILFVILVNQHVIQSELYVGILCLITLMIHVLFWTLANYLPMPHSFLESSFQTRVQAKTKFWKWHRWSFRTADCFFFYYYRTDRRGRQIAFFFRTDRRGQQIAYHTSDRAIFTSERAGKQRLLFDRNMVD